ncbi:MAG: NAD(P)H-dependent oxidoreductase subunit E [Planctomycetota bacterium]|nr:MAG: NAD(P)H-dependent oxidoreductase subunit E [Planctomycetota bacterium]
MKTTQKYEFNQEQMAKFQEILTHYPQKRSAILPALYLAQETWGEINPAIMEYLASLLEMTPAKVREVFEFYTFFRRPGCGKYRIDVCHTLSCALRGAKDILEHIKKKLNLEVGETTKDGKFSLTKVECIAACDKAPAIQINGEYYENLTLEKVDKILDSLE